MLLDHLTTQFRSSRTLCTDHDIRPQQLSTRSVASTADANRVAAFADVGQDAFGDVKMPAMQ